MGACQCADSGPVSADRSARLPTGIAGMKLPYKTERETGSEGVTCQMKHEGLEPKS